MVASPERALLFDVNDFDETLPGPFEHDVKRMAASFVICGPNNGFSHDSTQALSKLAELVDGQYRIVSQPPVIVPARDLRAVPGRRHAGSAPRDMKGSAWST